MILIADLPIALSVPGVCAKGVSPKAWAEVLNPWMVSAGINTPKRIAAFIGQVSVESAGFSRLSENLNYGVGSLLTVWPDHFTPELATDCAHDPEKIANVAYANRLGNGDEDSGDGWCYRGAGLIQLTGKDNHTRFAQAIKADPTKVGDLLRSPGGAAQSACWFWSERRLNVPADGWMLTALSKVINGGTNGLTQRLTLCNTILKAISP